jgi:voltage-gated potassium channel Kch
VIVEAINGYLLIGFIFSVLVTFVMIFNPQAYNFPDINSPNYYEVSHISDYLYYAFVTFTTLGYGDIVPQIPVARSLAILTSITGQIYIAIIIALLVGKFAGSQTDK